MWCVGLLVMWCGQSMPSAADGATFCQIAQPLYWSKNDTRRTKEQADEHNRVWKKLCRTNK